MTALKPVKRTFSAALPIFTALVVSTFLIAHLSYLTIQPPRIAQASAKCIVYDRPPRTGSTTISTSLARCIRGKSYKVTKLPDRKRAGAITEMLSSSSDQLAAVSSHIAVSGNDIYNLEQRCGQLLYITSCAPMSKRLYSAAKYQFSDDHGNSTVDVQEDKIARKVNRLGWVEPFLEAYPHVTEEKTPLENMPERIVPDYVIRSDKVNEDLGKLLGALGCENNIQTKNVHAAKVNETAVLSRIELGMGDNIYRWLLKVAEGNELGLQKAQLF